jgi:tetratricopeptide (TPR) repeat protein
MTKERKIYLGLLLLVVLIIAAVYVFWLNKKGSFLVGANWDNPDYVFKVNIPADFDDYKKGRLQEKIEEARKAYDEAKDKNYTWDIIGNMYLYAKDYDRALLAFQKALATEPGDITAVLNLGTIYEDYKPDYQEAEKYYTQAITIFPNLPDLYSRLGKLYWLKMNKLEDAETIYLQGLEKTSQQADSFLNLLDFYAKTGQVAKQKVYAAKFLELYPDNAVYQKAFGDLVK